MSDSLASRRFSVTASVLGMPIRGAIERVSQSGIGSVQLNAAAPGLRPREFGKSARRDLLAILRRFELTLSGLDLWIPDRDFTDSTRSDRAFNALSQTMQLAADLGRVPVSVTLPRTKGEDDHVSCDETILDEISSHSGSLGIDIVDFAFPVREPEGGILAGIDPPLLLSQAADPLQLAMQAGSALGQFRLADLDRTGARVPLGTSGGRLSVFEVKAALDVIGLRPAPVIDTRGWRDPWSGVETTLACW